LQDLKQKLSQEFSLLCFEDLALVSADPYFLRSILSTNWQKSYTPHQRFAFFSGQSPDLALLSWIKSICEQCDVSASFILLICPVNITDLINKIFADMDRFQCIVQSVSGGLLTQGYAINDTICVLPWMHLSIYNQGQIHPCCRNTMNMGSIDSHNPREVFNSHDLKNLRLALKSGIRADSCSSCWKVENSGGFSHRQLMLKYHGQKFFSKFLHHPNIQSLDVKTGNTCNFTCRICSPMVSSAIAQESLKHTPDGDI
jgi:radical SAM protein with 4Fe4S-binding SPASM domain